MERVDDRLRRLEDIAFEGDGLTRAVTRLGMNANALGEALLTVDKNQQQLTKLGRELKEVRRNAVSDFEVQATVRAEKKLERRKLILGVIFPVVLVLSSLLFALSEAAHDACEKRQRATQAVIDTLVTFRNPNTADKIDAGVDRLEATLKQSCDSQYVLHLP